MFYTIDTLINCLCCGFVAAAVPLIIFEVLADIKNNKEEKKDEFFFNGEWHRK